MKIIGPLPFERNESGKLLARIGTIFLKTPGLITTNGIHAMQRMAWIDYLNTERDKQGLQPLSETEIDEEMAESVDLLFDENFALIRPDPNDMETAFRGDELLQEIISKRKIRYLNIQNRLVRDNLRMRGEAWRMSPIPLYEEELRKMIEESKVGIGGAPIYYYNRLTGTRFLTLATFRELAKLPHTEKLFLLKEICKNVQSRNRFANPEIACFPVETAPPMEFWKCCNFDEMNEAELTAWHSKVLEEYEKKVPAALRFDDMNNADWRRAISETLVHSGHDTGVTAVISGLSPEFFMQIEWLPGGRIEEGELMFDPVFNERDAHPDDAELQRLCDNRAREILLNYLREYSNIEYVNIGRTRRSLSRRTGQGPRAHVYIVELKEGLTEKPIVKIIRIQRWTIISHLEEGKPLLDSIIEAEEYTDYVMDRRLGCRQLGMKLPPRMTPRRLREHCKAAEIANFYAWTTYFERDYIAGRATDKIPKIFYENENFNLRFCSLLGHAAANNIIVGRATLKQQTIFDDGDEVILMDDSGLPVDLILSEPTGAFSNYQRSYEEDLPIYANAMKKRRELMPNFEDAVAEYLIGFENELQRVKLVYQSRRKAFDSLFKDRPFDPDGSLAYRWQCLLKRLDTANPQTLMQHLENLIFEK